MMPGPIEPIDDLKRKEPELEQQRCRLEPLKTVTHTTAPGPSPPPPPSLTNTAVIVVRAYIFTARDFGRLGEEGQIRLYTPRAV
jgi:hypothetical protein